MLKIQSFYAFKQRFTQWGIALLVLVGLAFVGVNYASAAEIDQCQIWHSGRLQAIGDGEFEACADEVIEQGETISGRYRVGKWGTYTVATDANRNAWVRTQGRRNFRFYGQIPETVTQAEPDPNDPDGDQIFGEADACATEAETVNGVFDNDGCPDSISDLLTFAENDLNSWWQAQFDESNLTYYPPTRVVSYRDPRNPRLNNNAFYTSGGHYIGYDLDLMESSLNRFGDFAPVAIMAHEWGHLVQANLGIREEYTILQELQADCLAGAYGTYLQDRGNLEEGDLDEALHQMFSIGDHPSIPWHHENAHGTGEQRYEAFQLGFDEGVDVCLQTYTG